ncbi:hypothetical protein [Rhizobium sp. CF142]|uniref:hypothetical protein n=1 Tax=Rhizobium sp. CF142 TaxID=1144314 RepID=UPI00026EF337|nr:hypothetical protein [Rhizobium sp. CF142]EJJ26564.1 hypothetical protein PMI11_05198 [Rhizobium sp. CF142]
MVGQEIGGAIEYDELSVVDRILTEFVNAVAAEDGYSDISIRLRHVILEKRDFNESSLERALFDVEQQ